MKLKNIKDTILAFMRITILAFMWITILLIELIISTILIIVTVIAVLFGMALSLLSFGKIKLININIKRKQ